MYVFVELPTSNRESAYSYEQTNLVNKATRKLSAVSFQRWRCATSPRHNLYSVFMLSMVLVWLFITAGASDTHTRGVQLYKEQKYAEAVAVLQDAVKEETPGTEPFKESVLFIGQSYFMMAQAPKAIPWLEKLPEVNEANYMLGYAYIQNKQPEQSETAFARLFGLRPESSSAHLMAAEMLLKKEYEAYAAAEARKALEMEPKLPQAHFLLGEIAIGSGNPDEGLAEMTQEIQVNPSFSMAWYRRGDAYVRKENWAAAIADLERAVWLNPDFSGPYILLGKCYFKTASYSNAEGILRRALTVDPRNYSATYLLGQTLLSEGKRDEGREVLEKSRSLQQR